MSRVFYLFEFELVVVHEEASDFLENGHLFLVVLKNLVPRYLKQALILLFVIDMIGLVVGGRLAFALGRVDCVGEPRRTLRPL